MLLLLAARSRLRAPCDARRHCPRCGQDRVLWGLLMRRRQGLRRGAAGRRNCALGRRRRRCRACRASQHRIPAPKCRIGPAGRQRRGSRGRSRASSRARAARAGRPGGSGAI